ncbi:MAG: hypothetical protein DRI44_06130 [Chlamydiae bacterium]|nr:MAG: hypothetical protein DRI44_06130 [Chlamydiota bacterium]
MTKFGSANVKPSNVAESVWKLWSDGSALNDVNMNVYPIDFVIGTGQGFIAGYDTGGFKITAQQTPGTGIFWDSGVYYVRTNNTYISNDPNRQTAVRIYAPDSGTLNLHPFNAGTTGWSFIYLDDQGTINEATGLSWADGDAVSNTKYKVLVAKIIRDGNNTIEQSDIVDYRTFVHPTENASMTRSILPTINYYGLSNTSGINLVNNGTIIQTSIRIHHKNNPVLIMAQATFQADTGDSNFRIYVSDNGTKLSMGVDVRANEYISLDYQGTASLVWCGTLSEGMHDMILSAEINNNGSVPAGYSQLVIIEYRIYG